MFTKKLKNLKMSNKLVILIGILCIISGVAVLESNYLLSKRDKVYERMSFELSSIPDSILNDTLENDEDLSDSEGVINEIINNEVVNNNDGEIKEPNKPTTITYNYIGYLEIPKINLKKGFVDIKSKDNNVNKNVAIMKDSVYPDVDGSLMVMASHNGTCWNCYFKNLKKLSNNDIIYIYYDDVRYTYKLVNIYEVKKTGKVSIYRNSRKTTLALVTCKLGTKDTQVVYIAELQSKQRI